MPDKCLQKLWQLFNPSILKSSAKEKKSKTAKKRKSTAKKAKPGNRKSRGSTKSKPGRVSSGYMQQDSSDDEY